MWQLTRLASTIMTALQHFHLSTLVRVACWTRISRILSIIQYLRPNTHAMRQFSSVHSCKWSAATWMIAVPVVQLLISPLRNTLQTVFTSLHCSLVMPHSWQVSISSAGPWNMCWRAFSMASGSTLCRRQGRAKHSYQQCHAGTHCKRALSICAIHRTPTRGQLTHVHHMTAPSQSCN